MLSKIKELRALSAELSGFIFSRKAYWLAPVIFILVLVGSLFFILEGSVIAPFIYAIF